MDLTFTPEQEMLRETVRQMLAKHSSPEIVRELEDDPAGYRDELWQELARSDLLGLTIPESYGGAAQTALETAILYEEMGRALASTPHLTTAVIGATLLRFAGSAAQQEAWLPRIARGDAVLTVAWLEPGGGEGPASIRAAAEPAGDGWRLVGTKSRVPFARAASALLVLARTGREPLDVGLFLVDPRAVETEQQLSLGSGTEFLVTLGGASGEQVGVLGGGWHAFEEAMCDGWIALAAYAVGGARRALEMAVGYAKERVQFDRPIGSFQGLAHPLAEMAMEIEGGAVLVRQAAWVRAQGDRPAGTLAAMAKMYCCDVFRRTTKVAQQVFGGIGFTRDIDIQLYFRRAKDLELSWFGPRALEERIAAAELDTPVPFVHADAGMGR